MESTSDALEASGPEWPPSLRKCIRIFQRNRTNSMCVCYLFFFFFFCGPLLKSLLNLL